jgi:hypothetical protein
MADGNAGGSCHAAVEVYHYQSRYLSAGKRRTLMNQKIAVKGNQALTLEENVHQIRSREDFTDFLGVLLADFKKNPNDWENRDLDSFLKALKAWVEDMDGYFQNLGETVPAQPSWKTLGQILLAAKVYE